MIHFKPSLFLILFLAVLIILFIGLQFFSPSKLKTVEINGIRISAEIADTSVKKAKGLSGRSSLPENKGMLFLFQKPDYYHFWMKNMLVPLDFVWIRDKKVVEITENVQPADYQPPKNLIPKNKADAVLEINAGLIGKFNIKAGDEVSF